MLEPRRIDHPYIFINKTLRRFANVPGPDGDPWRALFKEPARVRLLWRPSPTRA